MSLEDLVRHPKIRRGSGRDFSARAAGVVATGFPVLDGLLAGGGWPERAIIEVFVDHHGIGELSLFMPALARLAAARPIVWIAPPFLPFPPALARCGLDLRRVLLVRVDGDTSDRLWAAEQTLLSAPGMVVLAWLQQERRDRQTDLRRLQLAAEDEHGWVVLFRPMPSSAQRSPAALRLKLSVRAAGMRAEVLKCRGGRPGAVDIDLSGRVAG